MVSAGARAPNRSWCWGWDLSSGMVAMTACDRDQLGEMELTGCAWVVTRSRGAFESAGKKSGRSRWKSILVSTEIVLSHP